MDIASELVYRFGPHLGRAALVSLALVAGLIVLSWLALAAGAWIADLLQPASEPILAAPLRW